MTEEKKLEQQTNQMSRDPKGLGFLLLKILFVGVLAAFLWFVYSGGDAKNVDLADIEGSIKTETDCTSLMKDASDRDLMQFIGLNAMDYEQVIYYRNTQALAVDELLIVKVENEAQLAGVEDAVQKRIDSQITAYSGYGPEQVKLLKNAAVKKIGKYYFYCTAPDADKYKEVFLNAVQ